MPGIRELKKQRDQFPDGDPRRLAIEKKIDAKRRKRDEPSPTKLEGEWLTKQGAAWGIVEQTIAHTFIKRDFIGVVDAICFSPSMGVCGVQICSDGRSGDGARGSDVGARQAKCEAEPRLVLWLKSGASFEIHSWGLRGAAGAAKIWTLRRTRAFLVGERIGFTEIES